MQKIVLAFVAVMACAQGTALGQSGPPKEAVFISDAQVKEVLKYAPPKTDQTLRVVDMGGYQMSVAIVHRGKTQPPPAPGAAPANRPPAAPAANVEKCGLKEAPAGAEMSPPGMIEHSDTVETYIVVSGGGTLVTGGEMVNGNKSAPDSEITTILNGPSCSGRSAGTLVSRHMGVGDIAIIPPGVPHGWTDITDHVDYLTVRPDPNKVLQHGYVNPHLADAK